jgi:hypothetical protein
VLPRRVLAVMESTVFGCVVFLYGCVIARDLYGEIRTMADLADFLVSKTALHKTPTRFRATQLLKLQHLHLLLYHLQ